ncbi:MAG TPA: hypothetical protein VHV56_10495 [Pseudolabrys sp.]|nr:hypothetical protein [Pseudolabrys sp.]
MSTGARVLLYSDDMTLRVPDGVELVDAAEMQPRRTQSFSYADGDICLTPLSDLFRYMAVERFGGWYFDLDVVCMRDSLPQSKVYLARENEQLINGAVMTLPAHSPVLRAAVDIAGNTGPGADRLAIGPDLVTRLVDEYALGHLIHPRSSAYEVGGGEVLSFFDPDARERLDERVAESDFVHLWSEIWRRIRIPKNYGPPEGSFLDGLFRRFDIRFTSEARLSFAALESWERDRQLLAHFTAGGMATVEAAPATTPAKRIHKAAVRQTLRTFWQGESMGPYQLLCLRSFVDRGHRVEVYTTNRALGLPRWLTRKNAEDIVDPDQVVRYQPQHERVAINAELFRYALLHQLGGWWIDPDVVLLADELPTGDLFISGPNEFDLVSTAAVMVPAGHPLLGAALQRVAPFGRTSSDLDNSDAAELTRAVAAQVPAKLVPADLVSPISWFDVSRLFDPSKADTITEQCDSSVFLDLHHDVWLRAGIPFYLGPPPGSFIDRLFQQHKIGFQFTEHMEFADVRRWLAHMYGCLDRRNASPKE